MPKKAGMEQLQKYSAFLQREDKKKSLYTIEIYLTVRYNEDIFE